jgi:hypothetical protein
MPSHLLMVHSAAREQVFRLLVSQPDRDWTVSAVAELLPGVSVDSVRTTLHLLMGDRLMDIVRFQRSLTLRLNSGGLTMVLAILRSWNIEAASLTPTARPTP